MKTYKNANFTKRNYDCTNVVFCQAEKAPSQNWLEVDSIEIDLAKCQSLHTENNVKYYGWL